MLQPEVVERAVAAMRRAVSIPVTVKHRLGVDDMDSEADLARAAAARAARRPRPASRPSGTLGPAPTEQWRHRPATGAAATFPRGYQFPTTYSTVQCVSRLYRQGWSSGSMLYTRFIHAPRPFFVVLHSYAQ
jgi:hypothetical protein